MADGRDSDFAPLAALTAGVTTGRLVSVGGAPLVRVGEAAAQTARSIVTLAPSDAGREVLLAFEGGDAEKPVILGLLQTEATTDTVITTEDGAVVIEAEQRLILRCGKASVMLTADGRIAVRGGYLVSEATGANRIRGASIHLN
ncbi:MAG: DUF6484 domain-containing protein [Pseudomonadota bacterium]